MQDRSVSPHSVNKNEPRGRNEKFTTDVSRNKRHHVSQEKSVGASRNTNMFQCQLTINTIKKSPIPKTSVTRQYIKKINPNFVIKSKSKDKDKQPARTIIKTNILEIKNENRRNQNIKTAAGNSISNRFDSFTGSKKTPQSINLSTAKKSGDNSRTTIDNKSLKWSGGCNVASLSVGKTRENKTELLSCPGKSRNIGKKLNLFQTTRDKNVSFNNKSIDHAIKNRCNIMISHYGLLRFSNKKPPNKNVILNANRSMSVNRDKTKHNQQIYKTFVEAKNILHKNTTRNISQPPFSTFYRKIR